MMADDLLADLRRRGVELFLDAGKIRYRAPRGVLSDADRAAVAAHRAELLEQLSVVWAPPTGGETRSPHSPEADTALARVLGDLAEARRRQADRPARLAVLSVVEGVFRRHHERGDVLLTDDEPMVSEMAATWAEEDGRRAHGPRRGGRGHEHRNGRNGRTAGTA
jgi:hypothetical protein